MWEDTYRACKIFWRDSDQGKNPNCWFLSPLLVFRACGLFAYTEDTCNELEQYLLKIQFKQGLENNENCKESVI